MGKKQPSVTMSIASYNTIEAEVQRLEAKVQELESIIEGFERIIDVAMPSRNHRKALNAIKAEGIREMRSSVKYEYAEYTDGYSYVSIKLDDIDKYADKLESKDGE